MEFITLLKKNNLYLKVIIAGFGLLFAILIGYAFIHNTYYFPDEDEGLYYNGARLYAETGSARAADCNNEDVSKIGHFDWYGPAYHLFYGSVAKIAGIHVYNFIGINLCCLSLIIILVLFSNTETETKLLILCSFLASYAFVAYTFTLYPETLQLLFAVILTLQLHKIYLTTKTKPANKEIAVYTILVILFSFFRVTTVFWIFGLVAFSASAKDFLKKLTIGILCFIVIFSYIILFNAPAFVGGMAHLMHDKFGLDIVTTLIKTFCKSVYVFFTRNPFYDLLIIPVLVIVLYSWLVNRNKFVLAASIISIIYFIVLLTLYIPYSFFINKQTACLFPLLLMALYFTDLSRLKYLTVFLLILFGPITYLRAAGVVRAHKKIALENISLKPVTEKLQQIRANIKDSKPVTIVTLYRDFDSKIPCTIFTGNLPVSTADNYPILYSSRSYDLNSNPENYSSNFSPSHKLLIDYFLSKYPLKVDSVLLICSNDLFYLYKNKKIK